MKAIRTKTTLAAALPCRFCSSAAGKACGTCIYNASSTGLDNNYSAVREAPAGNAPKKARRCRKEKKNPR